MSLEEKLYTLLKKINKELTTNEIQKQSFLLQQEYCLDSIVPALEKLAKQKKIDKKYSNKQKTFIWKIK